MIPSQPPTSKRKSTDDGNPLTATVKKVKREASKTGASNKRKLNGDEQPGGLVIVRAPAPANRTLHIERLPSESRAPSQPPLPVTHPDPTSSKPPSKKLRADGSSSRVVGRGKEREVYATTRADPEVDEDVRQMQSETDTLRRRSQAAEQAAGPPNPALDFPAPRSRPPNSRGRVMDIVQPIAQQETPQIEKNRRMRGEGPTHRRRSSLTRGKRVSTSFESTGVISQPHTSVSSSSFHKHIDGELPDPQRARQLLIWCSYRAMNDSQDQASKASSSKQSATNSGKDPPPLTPAQADILKRTEEAVIRMLAEKRVDTNVYGGGGSQNGDRPLKENEQNLRNRAREARFNGHIQRSKQESEAWKELSDSYDAHRKTVQADIEKRRRALASAKSKGKQRASAEDVDLDEWDVDKRDLPEQLSSGAIDLARTIVHPEQGKKSAVSERLKDIEYTIDRLRTFTHEALYTTRISEADLDRRFALLNISLASRSQPAPPPNPSALSSYVPITEPRPPRTDPQELLRTLTRIDAERPQTQVGDAARRAVREVQRAADSSAGMAERRLTGVPPPTPRKPPGTPRRATTPARGR